MKTVNRIQRGRPHRFGSGKTVLGERFYDWLMRQLGRSDRVGDLARFVHGDPTWPSYVNRKDLWMAHLKLSEFGGKDGVIEFAWLEWMAQ